MANVTTINRFSEQTMPKKSTSGAHKVPRIAVQIPKPYAELARVLAAKNKMPTVWYIMDMLAKQADEVGIDRPALPWEEDGADT